MRPPCGVQGEKTLPASNIIERFVRRAACMGRKQHRKREACFLRRDTCVCLCGMGECMAGKGDACPADGAQGEGTSPASNTWRDSSVMRCAWEENSAESWKSVFLNRDTACTCTGRENAWRARMTRVRRTARKGRKGRQQTTCVEIRSPCGEQGKEMSPASNTMAISVRHVACKGRKWR